MPAASRLERTDMLKTTTLYPDPKCGLTPTDIYAPPGYPCRTETKAFHVQFRSALSSARQIRPVPPGQQSQPVRCEAASNWAGIRTATEVTGIDGTVVIIARSHAPARLQPRRLRSLANGFGSSPPTPIPTIMIGGPPDRSFALTLDLLAQRRLNIAPMLTHEFPWHELPGVYRRLDEGDKSIVGTTIRWD